MLTRPLLVATLVVGSGFCALVYETAWIRLLRLVFGASTAASAAAVGIFMAGLGVGSVVFGRRADRADNGLALYSKLEYGIALSAGCSPFLIELVRAVYLWTGGTVALGTPGATVVRLLLTALALGVPTVLMGGTLPAVARAVASSSDAARRHVALVYACNTLGAVCGVVVTTFLLLEVFGLRTSIWLVCLLNLLVATLARSLARSATPQETAAEPEGPATPEDGASHAATVRLVLIAAGLVGFAFFVMELVWYRTLAPILGGTSYTFGLILATALLGIGAGGLLYSLGGQRRRPTLLVFALTCSLEALFLLVPFAAGDAVAAFAMLSRTLAAWGLPGLSLSWAVVTAVVVLPAATVAGYQFPLLVAILGRGSRAVGRQVGQAYAANTAGAITGSLAGGFGLLPLLTAPGAWRAMGALLVGLAVVSLVVGLRGGGRRRAAVLPLVVAVICALLATARGPTAFWRHSPIGVGRTPGHFDSSQELSAYVRDMRRGVVWETEGVESSVAMRLGDSYSFIVNGKSDGNARVDAPTMVMAGLAGALLHPDPRRALVIGLGTGETAGWLAQVPGMERVDVVEIEPEIRHVAELCKAVTFDVLADPKVHLYDGDGREFLLTSDEQYDLIVSEPSNPYRAGIASLFSKNFYEAVASRIGDNGTFLQWMQAYEVDAKTIRTVYATVGSVFPEVETWALHQTDMLLMARLSPTDHDLARVRERAAQEPFASGLALTWGVEGAAGLYTGYVASAELARRLAAGEQGEINTDDMPLLEFGFARGVGGRAGFRPTDVLVLARRLGLDRPPVTGGHLDWDLVEDQRTARALYGALPASRVTTTDAVVRRRVAARQAYNDDRPGVALSTWRGQDRPPAGHADQAMLCELLAVAGDPELPACADGLARYGAAAADLARGVWSTARGDRTAAAEALVRGLSGLRTDPWAFRGIVTRALSAADRVAAGDAAAARRLFEALAQPFAAGIREEARLHARVGLASRTGVDAHCVQALAGFEPHTPWTLQFLRARYACYAKNRHALEGRALEDLQGFLAASPTRLDGALDL